MQKNVIVIGGGPAGIEAAKTAAFAGARVTLISNSPIGGRAGWHSLLPSKVWLTAAETLQIIDKAPSLGISTKSAAVDVTKVLARIHKLAETWNHEKAQQLRQLGVNLVTGTASFTAKKTVAVKNGAGQIQEIQGDAFIVASGSVPIFPANMKPDGKQIIAPRFAKALQSLPASIVVVGGGVTGSEFVYLFNRLGVRVTWIVDEYGVLPTFHAQAGHALSEALTEQGVELVAGKAAAHIEKHDDQVKVILADNKAYNAEMAFLAIGRKPDLADLNLGASGTGMGAKIVLDEYGRLADTDIYLVGDAAGAPMVANRAMAQAQVAANHAVNPLGVRPFDPQTIIAATYTTPQVAQVGEVNQNGNHKFIHLPFNAVLKGRLLPEKNGFILLTYEREKGIVKGAVAFGNHAADLLAPVSLGIQQQATIDNLAMIYPAHPTLSELVFAAARSAVSGT